MSTDNEFGCLLRRQRMAANKTITEAAAYLGVSLSFLSGVERGLRAPLTNDKLLKLGDYFGIDPTPLLKAAACKRGSFELATAGMSERAVALGAKLTLRWGSLSEEELQSIMELL